MKWLAGYVIALVLHLLAGWPFSLAGGIVAGYLVGDRGWLTGGIAVGLSWLTLVGYNFVVAPESNAEMIRVMAAIMGNMPESLFVVLSILTGCVLGVAGGLIGTQLARVVAGFGNRPARR